jgi:cytochrome c-type biogenesis protein CcmH/NrfG
LLRALQLDPSLGVARYNLALALVRLGEDAGAVAQWQYLAAHEPNTNEGRQAQQILSRLRQAPPAQRPPGAAR